MTDEKLKELFDRNSEWVSDDHKIMLFDNFKEAMLESELSKKDDMCTIIYSTTHEGRVVGKKGVCNFFPGFTIHKLNHSCGLITLDKPESLGDYCSNCGKFIKKPIEVVK